MKYTEGGVENTGFLVENGHLGDQPTAVVAIPYCSSVNREAVGVQPIEDLTDSESIFDVVDDNRLELALYTKISTMASIAISGALQKDGRNTEGVICLGEYTFGQSNRSGGDMQAELCEQYEQIPWVPESRDLQTSKGQIEAIRDEIKEDVALVIVGWRFHLERLSNELQKAGFPEERLDYVAVETAIPLIPVGATGHINSNETRAALRHINEFHGREIGLGLAREVKLEETALKVHSWLTAAKQRVSPSAVPRTAGVDNVIVNKQGETKFIRPGSEEWVVALNNINRLHDGAHDELVSDLADDLLEFGYTESM